MKRAILPLLATGAGAAAIWHWMQKKNSQVVSHLPSTLKEPENFEHGKPEKWDRRVKASPTELALYQTLRF